MGEVSKEAVEALGKSINRSTTYLLDSEEIRDVCDGLAKYGYTIAPIANPASDEKLREAADNLEGYEFICEGGNLRNCADWHDIKAALAELAERRAAEPAPLPDVEIPEGFKYTPAQQVVWDWWCNHEKAPPICDDLNDLILKLDAIKTEQLPDDVVHDIFSRYEQGKVLKLDIDTIQHMAFDIEALRAHISTLETQLTALRHAAEIGLAYVVAAQSGLTFTRPQMAGDIEVINDVLKMGGE